MNTFESNQGVNPYSTPEGRKDMQRKQLEYSGEWETKGKVSFDRFDDNIKKSLTFLFGEDMLQASPEQIADELILQANNEEAKVSPEVKTLAKYLGVDNLFWPVWNGRQNLFGNEKEKIIQAVQGSIRLTKSSEPASPTENITTESGLSEEDRKQGEIFIDTFVTNNVGLSVEAKEMLIDKVKSQRGAWSVKDFVQAVTQEDKKVTIKTKSGEMFLYVE